MISRGPLTVFLSPTLGRWHNFRTLCDYSKRIAVGESTGSWESGNLLGARVSRSIPGLGRQRQVELFEFKASRV